MINTLERGPEVYYLCLRALRKTCGIYGILLAPSCMSQGLIPVTIGKMKRPFAPGDFKFFPTCGVKAEGYEGQIFTIKHLRTYDTDDLTNMKKVLRVPKNIVKRSPSAGE